MSIIEERYQSRITMGHPRNAEAVKRELLAEDKLAFERSETNRAYSRIAELEEQERRVGEDEYLNEQERKRSKLNRAHSRIQEEKEKERRISEDAYLDEVEEVSVRLIFFDHLIAVVAGSH